MTKWAHGRMVTCAWLPCADVVTFCHRSALITYGDKLDDGTSSRHGNMRLHGVHKMVERVLSNHILMGTISQEILTFPFHDTILGINRQAWN